MSPALAQGDEFVASDSVDPVVGDIVTFLHPEREDAFWLVKRVTRLIDDGHVWVESDNKSLATADSRRFGALPNSDVSTVVTRLDAALFTEAVDMLVQEDVSLAAIVSAHGVPEFWSRAEGFPTLVWLILEQQVSLESGAAMYRRLTDLAGAVTPDRIVDTGEEELRRIGVTRQKAGYIVDLAQQIVSGSLSMDEVGSAPPETAREMLMGVRGIGPWTADAYLLSALGHIDMFPSGDRALQVGMRDALGMSHVPTSDETEILAEPWRPVRAVAARLIWHAYLTERGRVEPPTPV